MSSASNRSRSRLLLAAALFLGLFVLWTALVCTVDVRPVGPEGSAVGLATVNAAFHGLTGVHLALYDVTDWFSLVAILLMVGFAALGFAQMVSRRSLLRVDRDILLLGCYYVVLLGAYMVFEVLAINYRPVLIDGVLEASYPSSTTLLVLCTVPTAIMQLDRRIGSTAVRRAATAALAVFAAFMVAARLLSGVHWLTDIVGGILLSAALVLAYKAVAFE